MKDIKILKIIITMFIFVVCIGSASLYATDKQTKTLTRAGQVSYTLTFDVNTGDSTGNTSQLVLENNLATPVTEPTFPDYQFIGWNTDIDGEGEFWDFSTSLMPSIDTVLYAQWEPVLYDAVFDINGGDNVSIPTQKLAVGADILEPLEMPTKIGSEFLGWSLAPTDRTTVTFEYPMESGGITFYAQYNTLKYQLIYDQNGGVGGQPPRSVTYNSSVIKQSILPTRTGYTFDQINYCVDAQCTTTLKYGVAKMPPNDLTIYSKWDINNYQMKFNSNGAPGMNPATQSVVYQGLATRPTTINYPGYTFKGWNTMANGSGTTWDFDTNIMPANDVNLYAQWEINSYELKFDVNGGNTVNPESQTVVFNTLGSDPGKITQPGYTFVEWNTSADGTGSTWDFSTSKMPPNEVTLYAIWNKNPYKINFDLGGAPGIKPGEQTILYNELVADPGIISNPGYTFDGWNTEFDGSGTAWDFTTDPMPAHEVVLHAQWKINSYQLMFDVNGGNETNPQSQTVVYNTLGTNPGVITQTGYTFVEWNTKKDGSGSEWDFATSKMPPDDLTLYAMWDKNPYQLSFDLNGAPGIKPTDQTVLYGDLLNDPGQVINPGYTFNGWNTSLDGSGSTWNFTNDQMPANEVVLYAQWEINSYQLMFDINGGIETNPQDQTVVFNALATNPGVVTQPGYTFIGWNTNLDGQGSKWDFTSSKMPANDITLYAMWDKNPYQMSFDLNGASGIMPSQQTVLYGDFANNPGAVINPGYAFSGWNTESDGSGTTWDFATNKMPANDFVLYAQWKINSYQLNFDVNGGVGANPQSQVVTYDTLGTDPGVISQVGHTFIGWNTSVDGKGTTWDFSTSKMPANDITLYAMWNKNLYPMSFELNGAPGSKPTDQMVLYGNLAKDPGSFTNPGFTFKGWNTSIDGSGTTWDFLSSEMPAQEVKLYAQWEINSYQLKFDVNGGAEANPQSQSVVYNTLATNPGVITKPGFTFVEWNTSADGLGTAWDFAVDKMPASELLLYAIWDENPYEVSFDLNGVTGEVPKAQVILKGNSIFRPTDPEIFGKIFVGWSTDPTGESTIWNFTNDMMPNKNMKLYAIWEDAKYVVSYDLNGGIGNIPKDESVIIGGLVSNPNSVPTLNGFTFSGWNTTADGMGSNWDFSSSLMPADNITLYAKWIKKPYVVKFDPNGLGNIELMDQFVAENMLVTEPNMANMAGYKFNGWYFNTPTGLVKWDFTSDQMPASDVTLVANWEKIPYTVMFNYNGAVSNGINDQVLFINDKITEPIMPTKAGYKFMNWVMQDGTVWDFAMMGMPAQNIVLTAQFEELVVNIKFNANGSMFTVPGNISTKANSMIEEPMFDKDMPGYKFLGWSLTPDGSSGLIDFSNFIFSSDVTLYALYEEVKIPESDIVEENIISNVEIVNSSEISGLSTKVKLVETGENTFELLIFGFILMIVSFVVFRRFVNK